MLQVDAGSNGQQLGDLFTMLLAGLAGTTASMVSAIRVYASYAAVKLLVYAALSY
jgi:hypothetical protein